MWYYSTNQLACERLTEYSLSVMQTATFPGARVAMSNIQGNDSAYWTINYEIGNSEFATIRNNNSGLYLTYVDSVTYSSSSLAALDRRTMGYAPDIDWSVYQTAEDLAASSSNFARRRAESLKANCFPQIPRHGYLWRRVNQITAYITHQTVCISE